MLNKLSISSLALVSALVLSGCGAEDPASTSTSSGSNNSSSGSTSSGSTSSGGVGNSVSSSGSSINVPDISIPPSGDNSSDIDSEATEFFFSYDESASTASRDLALVAIQNGTWVDSAWGRTYEFLNAETFTPFSPEAKSPFTVSMGLYKAVTDEIPVGQEYEGDLYSLGVNISGPELTKEDRKNVVLTILVDISGSMESSYASETSNDIRTLLDVTKHGLLEMADSLKEGDVLNLVTFDSSADIILTDWSFSGDDTTFDDAVTALYSQGSTNLDQGLSLAYQVAQASYDDAKSNRVIMFTDAYANTGSVNSTIIAENTTINNLEGIYFSGVGIGEGFNDAFLNNLTDIGKGTYSAMITPTDAERIMTQGFMRFVESAVSNVKFKLTYPQSMDQLQSAAEDISTDESEVSEINFAYNSSQFFLEMFDGSAEGTDELVLTATFENDGATQTIEITKTVEELLALGETEIKSAVLVTRLAKVIAQELSCEEVQRSGVYGQNIATDIFQTYRKAISDFCGPLKEELDLPANCKIEGDRVLCTVEGS